MNVATIHLDVTEYISTKIINWKLESINPNVSNLNKSIFNVVYKSKTKVM